MTLLPVVQARMGSTRLPGKALARIGYKTALEHVLDRVRAADIGEPVVATTWDIEDDRIVQLCGQWGVPCFRGHATDVLDRFHECAQLYGGDPIVRVTADCPLLDPVLLRQVADLIVRRRFHYVGVKGAPDGYHAEAFTRAALTLAHRLATSPSDREHVVPFMLARPAMFRPGWVEAAIDGEPVTLDTADDLERIRRIAA